jgi:hypothetical protein
MSTEGFEIFDDEMVELRDVREGKEVRGHVRRVELRHDKILRCKSGFAWRFLHKKKGSNYNLSS